MIIDVLGKNPFPRCRRVLRPCGRLIFVSFKMRQMLQSLWSVFGERKAVGALVAETQADLVVLKELIEAGKLTPLVDRSFPLERAAEAHRYAESGVGTGYVVVTVSA